MKSPLQKTSRFSGFRFALSDLRSPVSPLSPQPGSVVRPQLSTPHSSGKTTPTARGTPSPDAKDRSNVGITVVDGEGAMSQTPRALPTPALSPMTPWNASFHRNAAGSDQEAEYLRKTTYLGYARTLLAALLFATGAALTGTQGNILQRYNVSHLSADFNLLLWPVNINLKPAILCLVTGAVATLFSLINLLLSALPSPLPRFELKSGVFLASSTIALFLSLTSVILAQVLTPAAIFSSFVSGLSTITSTGPGNTTGQDATGNGQRETIHSFTCKMHNSAHAFDDDATKLGLPSLGSTSDLIPSGFGRLCAESKASVALVIAILVLSFFGLLVTAVEVVLRRKMVSLRNARQASRDGQPEDFVGLPYEKRAV